VSLLARRRARFELAERGSRLFQQYVSPDVAAVLLRNPTQSALGGATVEVSVLFADLPDFTSFSELASSADVVALLNRYYGAAAPIVLQEGGMVDKFVGDALMALFGAPVRHEDHAIRAVRAAMRVQRAVDEIANLEPGLPRFRIGVNSGPAVVGNIGSVEVRNFTAIGDAVNLAQRLQSVASPGQVVIGPRTRQAIGDDASVLPLGTVPIKGRTSPVEAFVLLGLRDDTRPGTEPRS
jgi:class 3 adenylate cyclase